MKVSVLAVIFFIVLLCTSCSADNRLFAHIINGRFDLSGFSSLEGRVIVLDGDWSLSSSADKDVTLISSVKVPGVWNSVGHKPFAHAYYMLRLTGVPQEPLALRFKRVLTAYRVFANGKELYHSGIPADNKKEYRPQFTNTFILLPTGVSTIDLEVEVANYDDPRGGGIFEAPLLGTHRSLYQELQFAIFLELVLFASMFIMGAYHVMIYLTYRKEKSALFFGLLLIVFAIRTLFTGERFILDLFQTMPWIVDFKIELLTVFGIGFCYALYIYWMVIPESKKMVWKLYLGFTVTLALLTLILPAPYYIFLLFIFYLPSLGMFLYSMLVMFAAWRHNRSIDALFIFANILILISTVNDMLYSMNIIKTGFMASFGIFLFMMLQAYYLSKRYSYSLNETKKYVALLAQVEKEQQTENERLMALIQTRNTQLDVQMRENKTLEDELIKIKQMSAASLSAKSIAADIDAHIGTIKKNIRLIKEKETGVPTDELSSIEKNSDKIELLAGELSLFSKEALPQFQTICLNTILTQAADATLRDTTIGYTCECAQEQIYVTADELQMVKVFTHLLSAFTEYSDKDGFIEISLVREKSDAAEHAHINIKNYGHRSTGDNIFNLFSTLKNYSITSRLSSAYSIIMNHKGTIEYTKNEGNRVAEFAVSLPCISPCQDDAVKKQEDTTGYILVIDDESDIITLLKRMIISVGYIPLSANDGETALATYKTFKKNGKKIICVIIDLVLPGMMNGKDIMSKLIEIDPAVRGVLSTGMYNDPAVKSYRAYGFKHLLQKPYTLEDFNKIITEIDQYIR